jgi:hypothetical protein
LLAALLEALDLVSVGARPGWFGQCPLHAPFRQGIDDPHAGVVELETRRRPRVDPIEDHLNVGLLCHPGERVAYQGQVVEAAASMTGEPDSEDAVVRRD